MGAKSDSPMARVYIVYALLVLIFLGLLSTELWNVLNGRRTLEHVIGDYGYVAAILLFLTLPRKIAAFAAATCMALVLCVQFSDTELGVISYKAKALENWYEIAFLVLCLVTIPFTFFNRKPSKPTAVSAR